MKSYRSGFENAFFTVTSTKKSKEYNSTYQTNDKMFTIGCSLAYKETVVTGISNN